MHRNKPERPLGRVVGVFALVLGSIFILKLHRLNAELWKRKRSFPEGICRGVAMGGHLQSSCRKRIYLGFGDHDGYWFINKRRVCRAAAPRPLRAVRGYSVRAAYTVAANRTRGGVGVKHEAASEDIALRGVNEAANGLDHKSRLTDKHEQRVHHQPTLCRVCTTSNTPLISRWAPCRRYRSEPDLRGQGRAATRNYFIMCVEIKNPRTNGQHRRRHLIVGWEEQRRALHGHDAAAFGEGRVGSSSVACDFGPAPPSTCISASRTRGCEVEETVKSRAMLHFQISTDAYSHSHDAFHAGLFEELCKKSPGAQEQHVAMWEFEQRQAVGTRYPATMFAGITLDAGMRETEKISPYCSVVFPPRKFLIKFL